MGLEYEEQHRFVNELPFALQKRFADYEKRRDNYKENLYDNFSSEHWKDYNEVNKELYKIMYSHLVNLINKRGIYDKTEFTMRVFDDGRITLLVYDLSKRTHTGYDGKQKHMKYLKNIIDFNPNELSEWKKENEELVKTNGNK